MPPVRTLVTLVPHDSWVGALKGPIQVRHAVNGIYRRLGTRIISVLRSTSCPSSRKELRTFSTLQCATPRHASRCLLLHPARTGNVIGLFRELHHIRHRNLENVDPHAKLVRSTSCPSSTEVTSTISHTSVCNAKTRFSGPSAPP